MIDIIFDKTTGLIHTTSKPEQNTQSLLNNWDNSDYFSVEELPINYVTTACKVDLLTKTLVVIPDVMDLFGPSY